MTIGELIRKERKAARMTQKQLGELAGINEVQLRQYEIGKTKPKYETLQKIADALLLPIETFLEDRPVIVIGRDLEHILSLLSFCGMRIEPFYKREENNDKRYFFHGVKVYIDENIVFLTKEEFERIAKQVEENMLNTFENFISLKKELTASTEKLGFNNDENIIYAMPVRRNNYKTHGNDQQEPDTKK